MVLLPSAIALPRRTYAIEKDRRMSSNSFSSLTLSDILGAAIISHGLTKTDPCHEDRPLDALKYHSSPMLSASFCAATITSSLPKRGYAIETDPSDLLGFLQGSSLRCLWCCYHQQQLIQIGLRQ